MQNEKRYLQNPASYYEYAMQRAPQSDIFNEMTLPEDVHLRFFWCRYIHYSYEARIKPNSKLHSHSFFELHCVLGGKLEYHKEGQEKKTLRAGSFLLIAPKSNHYLTSLTPEAETFAVTFEPSCRDTEQGKRLGLRFDSITDLLGEIPAEGYPLIEIIMQELHDGKAYATQNLRLLLHVLILDLIRSIFDRDAEKAEQASLRDPRLAELKKYMGDTPTKIFTVAELAEHLHISTRQLGNVIHADLGITAKEFIDTEKANQARDLLLGTEMNLQEISERLGFSDHNNFNRFFKRMEGMSPGLFRRSKG